MLHRVAQFVRNNGLLLLPDELLRHFRTRVRSEIYRYILNAKKLSIGPRSYIRGARYIQLGNGFYAGGDLWMEAVASYRGMSYQPRIVIKEKVSISRWTHISAINYIEIGCNALIGSKVIIVDHNHGLYSGERPSFPSEAPSMRILGGGGPVIIKENVWIGDNVVIMGPVEIGAGAIIAANSTVSRDVPAGTIVAGSPAKMLRKFNSFSGAWENV